MAMAKAFGLPPVGSFFFRGFEEDDDGDDDDGSANAYKMGINR